jgi:hypothetical protein
MDRKTFRTLAIVAAAMVVLAIASVLMRSAPTETVGGNERFFPGLLDAADTVEMLAVADKRETLTIELRDGRWRLAERSGYPARTDKVRAAILGLAELRVLEPKTSQKDQYSRLGVEDPGGKESSSKEITLFGAKGQKLASAIVGRPKFDLGGGERGLYIRRSGEEQAWLVRGQVDLGFNAADWLEREIVHVAEDRVASVTVRQPDGETLTASRAAATDKHLSIPGIALRRDDILADLLNGLSHLMLDDVRKADELEIADPYLTKVEVKTFDGLTIRFRFGKLLDETWVWFDAEGNGEEGAKLSARLKPWVFRIPTFKADRFARKIDDVRAAPGKDK